MARNSVKVCPLFNSSADSRANFYQNVIVDIRFGVSIISFCGSLFVIGLIWLFKKYKFFVQRLILYLSISAFLSSIAYAFGRVNYDPTSLERVKFCEAQGFFLLYTDWTVLLSIFCITLNLLLSVYTENKTRRIEMIFITVIFVLPLPISCIPFYKSSFGPSGVWCWIRNKNDNCSHFLTGQYLQFTVWYVPQYVMIVLLFGMYISIIVRLKTKVKTWQGTYDPNVEYKKSLIKKEIKPLIWYPTVYFLVSFLPLVNRIVSNIVTTPILSLYVLHVLTSPLQGALTALVYALDKDTLQRLKWSNIKASFKYRDTDKIVREYPVGPSIDESFPFIAEQSQSKITTSPTPSRRSSSPLNSQLRNYSSS